MYILDTDHLSLIQRNNQEGKRILSKLASVEEAEVAVTVITYEEVGSASCRGLKHQMSRFWHIKGYSNFRLTTAQSRSSLLTL
jgi:tRNA(fMet)-specific endonuclease VapC